MKYNGRKLEAPALVTLVFPRGNDEALVFRLAAVLDYKEFEAVCPQPKPPEKILRGGARQPDFSSPDFIRDMDTWAGRKTKWMLLKSLQATPELQWEKIDMADPGSWDKLEEELKESGFSEAEQVRLLNAAMEANSLDERKLEEAREGFFSGRIKVMGANASSSLKDDQKNTSPGEPVNGSVSDHQVLVPPGTI
jgi:hypothetical protein